MAETKFKLSGGGLFSRFLPERLLAGLGVRIGTVVLAWVPLLVLCLVAGNAVGSTVNIPFLSDPNPYARFLIALPLFLLAGVVIDRRLSAVVAYFWDTGILVGDTRQCYRDAVAEVERGRRSTIADLVLLTIAYVAAWIAGGLDVSDAYSTWFAYDMGDGQKMSPAGWWYTFVSLPLYQFVFFRWIWRILLWWRFLWRMSRLQLHLVPTHPDRAGGLGILEMGQMAFVALIIATSAVLAAELYDTMHREQYTLVSVLPTILVFFLLNVLLVVGPLFVFLQLLVRTKRWGLVKYGDMADDLFGAFDDKWTDKSDATQKELLGDADPSSLADFGYAYEVITAMRIVPFSLNNLIVVALATLVPFLPLLLTEYSIKEILRRLVSVVG